MARIVGIGETIYSIVMKNNLPQEGKPDGDIFNTMIVLGRKGLDATMISEVANDRLGHQILDFMQANGVKTESMYVYYEGRTPLAIAHIEESGRMEYDYYLSYPATQRLDVVWPRFDDVDYLVFGSTYVLLEPVHNTVMDLVNFAYDRRATIVYCPNLQHLEAGQSVWLMPAVIDCLEKTSLLVMKESDMLQLYKDSDPDSVYRNDVRFYCPVFMAIMNDGHVCLRTPSVSKDYLPAAGSGWTETFGKADAFRAGIVYGIHQQDANRESLKTLSETRWDEIVGEAFSFRL